MDGGFNIERVRCMFHLPPGSTSMPHSVQKIALFGSTGSIGTQTLDVVRSQADRLDVRVLSAWSNAELLVQQAREFQPEVVVIGREDKLDTVRTGLARTGIEVLVGQEGLVEAASLSGLDTVVTAVVGAAGLQLTLAAIAQGCRIALANKETLVVAGDLVSEAASQAGVEIVPVDSEHSAIHQCLLGEKHGAVERLILTASGGPFRGLGVAELESVTREQALAHPNWAMGSKITVDSATLMNKGLELIEAHWLFGIPAGLIDVVVHPQSIIHSMVEFVDGSTMAQLGPPDMRLPIQYALSFPLRWPLAIPRMDWTRATTLTFEAPDTASFPCLSLARHALQQGPEATAVLNAANEVAVSAFLEGRIGFMDIPRTNGKVLERLGSRSAATVEDRLALDAEARRYAQELMVSGVH